MTSVEELKKSFHRNESIAIAYIFIAVLAVVSFVLLCIFTYICLKNRGKLCLKKGESSKKSEVEGAHRVVSS